VLVEIGIAGDESPDLRIVIPRAHVRKPGVAVIAVAGGRGEGVRARTAARAPRDIAEGVEVQRADDGLRAVGDRPLGA